MPSVVLTPTVIANDSSIVFAGADEIAWTLNTSAISGEISSYDQVGDYSQYLKVTGMNGAIPDNAIINGVELTFNRTQELSVPAYDSRDLEVRMVVSGSVAGDNKAKAGDWPFSPTPSTYGGPTDTWGNALTAAIVNASDWGFAIANRVTLWQGSGASIRAGNFSVTVHYTPAATGEAQLTLTTSVAPAIESNRAELALVTSVSRETQSDLALATSVGPFLNLTEPDSGDTITTAAVLFEWETGPAAQSDFRLRVYSDATETTLVYDSGIVGSADGQHLAAAGQLPAGALWVRVTNHDANGMEGRSALVDFTTSFPTSVNVQGVTTEQLGGICDATALPGVRVRWSEVTPGGGETFVRYEVRRRKPGETAYVTIEHVDAVDELEYKDYAVVPSQVYEYAVVWVATSGASTLISANQTTPSRAGVKFDFTFLHSVSDPTVFVRLEHWEADVDLEQPTEVFQPWGREAGTAYTGEQFSHRISIPLHPQQRKDRRKWEALLALAREQRSGNVLCLRLGRDRERYFCVKTRLRKSVTQKSYSASIEMVEVGFDEAVSE